jgi:hypothetical protein
MPDIIEDLEETVSKSVKDGVLRYLHNCIRDKADDISYALEGLDLNEAPTEDTLKILARIDKHCAEVSLYIKKFTPIIERL